MNEIKSLSNLLDQLHKEAKEEGGRANKLNAMLFGQSLGVLILLKRKGLIDLADIKQWETDSETLSKLLATIGTEQDLAKDSENLEEIWGHVEKTIDATLAIAQMMGSDLAKIHEHKQKIYEEMKRLQGQDDEADPPAE